MKVHAHRAWTILCLLWIRSLGGNLKERQAKEWLHAFFICKIFTMIRKTILMFALSVMHIGILLICIGCSDDDDIAIQDVFCAQEAENVEGYEAVF